MNDRKSILPSLCLFCFCVVSVGCEQPTTKLQPAVVNPSLKTDATGRGVKETSSPQAKQESKQDDSNRVAPVQEPFAFGQDFLDFEKYSLEGLDAEINKGDFAVSTALIKHFLAKHPHDPRVHAARQKLAFNYARTKNDPAAMEINRELLEYFFHNADGNRELCELLPTTVVFMNSKLADVKKEQERREIVAEAVQLLRKNRAAFYDSSQVTNGIIQLVGTQIRYLVNNDKKAKASELADEEVREMKKILDAHPNSDQAQLAYANSLRNAFLNLPFDIEKNKTRLSEYEKIIVAGVDRDRTSKVFASQYSIVVQKRLSTLLQQDPDAAKTYYDQAFERMSDVAKNLPGDRSMARSLVFLKRFEARIDRLTKVKNLQGQPAPPLKATSWINGNELKRSEMKEGGVALLMFCNAASRPCVTCLPKIEKMALKHQAKLKVVAVARLENLAWDSSAGRAVKSKTAVSPADEIKTLEEFQKTNKITFRIAVTTSETFQSYGANSTPYFVLIDGEGKIQHITIGIDPEELKKLEDAIESVVAK